MAHTEEHVGFRFEASWAGIRIDVLSASVNHGRRQTPHESPKRDGAALEDGGRAPWVCEMRFIFIDTRRATFDSDTGFVSTTQIVSDYEARFKAFDKLVDEERTRPLVHPYQGSRQCKISNFRHDGDGETPSVITASATFTEDITQPGTRDAGGGTQVQAGAEEVRIAGEILNRTIADEAQFRADLGLAVPSSDSVDASIFAAESWATDITVTARQVSLESITLINQMNEELDAFEAGTRVDRWPLMRDYTQLQYSLRRTAESFQSTTTRLIQITATEPVPLLVLVARVYGADQADRRFQEVTELNPGLNQLSLVPRGTVIKAYSPDTGVEEFSSTSGRV